MVKPAVAEPDRPTIVIVGAGFSGAVTAVNVLRSAGADGARVVIVNHVTAMGRGLAYGTRTEGHLLNVPAGNMSALADDPDDFLRYCRWSDASITSGSFVPRRVYGTYLEALLTAAELGCAERTVLDRLVATVVAVRPLPTGDASVVELADGASIVADRVVLSFGNFVPRSPAVVQPLRNDPRYVGDPWARGSLDLLRGAADPVLLIGSGLTAIDVALALNPGDAPDTAVVCMSRHGLLPARHRDAQSPPSTSGPPNVPVPALITARGYLRSARRATDDEVRRGGDWRDVVASLRPTTPQLWRQLSLTERARFIRHVQPYWDVHRHRCAPVAHDRFSALVESGAVEIVAGRLVGARADTHGVVATIRPRAQGKSGSRRFAGIVNCSGPDTDLSRVGTPLAQQLIADGVVRLDPLRIGIDVDEEGAVIAADGAPSSVIFYIGPLLRARDWEATAVPELRAASARLARRLLT